MRFFYPLVGIIFYCLGWAGATAGFKYDKLLLLLLTLMVLLLLYKKREDLEMLEKFHRFVKRQEGKE